ncbi:MAG TPA: nickel-type superoxide dismutase maturation protease, partial [Acidimicrobiales bacterium]|nr:nickel-type superoxide dismutase maturation protease [Acidimicrobiales bacterium]
DGGEHSVEHAHGGLLFVRHGGWPVVHSGGMSVGSTLPSRPAGQHGRHRRGGADVRRRPGPARWVRRLVLVSAAGALASAVLGALVAGAAAVVGVRAATRRVVVEGRSMVPSFEPGDRLLVVRLPRRWPLWPGDVVALPDPRTPGRLLVKRVDAAGTGRVWVVGDNPAESTDSRSFGPVDRAEVWGRVLYRYAPAARAGRIRRPSQVVGNRDPAAIPFPADDVSALDEG